MRSSPLWLKTHRVVWTLFLRKSQENHRGHARSNFSDCISGQNCTSLLQGQVVIPSLLRHKTNSALQTKAKLLNSKLYWRKSNHRSTCSIQFRPLLHGKKNHLSEPLKDVASRLAFLLYLNTLWIKLLSLWGCSDSKFRLGNRAVVLAPQWLQQRFSMSR